MKRLIIISWGVVIALFTLVQIAISQAWGEKESLKGLEGVGVLVEDMQENAMRVGLNRTQIITDVELRLRMAGIKVLTREERYAQPGSPYLYVQVNSIYLESIEHLAYTVRVLLDQDVSLTHNNTQFRGATWKEGMIGNVHKYDAKEVVRDAVKDLIDKFINDYLAVNPK